ncbi:MAG: hypothetical protein AAGF91_07035 [Actinomycetota bacterium]
MPVVVMTVAEKNAHPQTDNLFIYRFESPDLGSKTIAFNTLASSPVAIDRRDVIEATEACGRPRWAKLSANTDRIIEVAASVAEAGAEGVTCINTVRGVAYDPDTCERVLGAGGGGLSGRAIHPVAVRAVHDVHAALPELPIVGVGGVASGWDAAEMMLAGASAVQVGTATFADPRAPAMVADELERWLVDRH